MKVLYVTSGNRFYPHNFLDQFIIKASKKNSFPTEIFELKVDTDWQSEFFGLVKRYQPEYVFTILGVYFPAEVVKELRELGVKIGIWCVDDPYDLDISKHLIYWYDYVFTTERQCIQLYRRHGANKVIYLHFGTECSVYYPEVQTSKYISDICLVGSPFPKRIELLNYILQKYPNLQVKVIGPDWKGKIDANIEVLAWSIEPEEVRKYYNGAKINLNFHRGAIEHISGATLNSAGIEATSPNSRTFDISACRAMQIIDYRPGLKDYFDLTDELVTFQNPDELVEKIYYYLQASAERERIAKKAYDKTLQKYQLAFSLRQMAAIVEHEIRYEQIELRPQSGITKYQLLKGEIKPAIYAVYNGYKHEIASIEAFSKFNFSWDDVKIVPEKDIEAIPTGNILT